MMLEFRRHRETQNLGIQKFHAGEDVLYESPRNQMCRHATKSVFEAKKRSNGRHRNALLMTGRRPNPVECPIDGLPRVDKLQLKFVKAAEEIVPNLSQERRSIAVKPTVEASKGVLTF